MKYVKENLTLVIVGLVTVLFLVGAFAWPLPSYVAGLKQQMQARADSKKTLDQWATTPLVLPGQEPAKGPPNQEWVEKKKNTIGQLVESKKLVDDSARNSNSKSRVDEKGVPLLPIPKDAAMNGGVPVGNHLPTSNDPMEFKGKYVTQFKYWKNLLATGALSDAEDTLTTPPRMEELQSKYNEQQAAAIARLPGAAANAANATVSATNRQFMDYAKNAVMNRAAGLKMYVEPTPNGLQVREWAFKDQAPTQEEIFNSLVDSWIQSDIIKAILLVNNQAMGSAIEKNVGKAAVKRLSRIVIGNAARTKQTFASSSSGGGGGGAPGAVQITDPGPLFFTSGNAAIVGGGGSVMGPKVNGGGAADVVADSPPNTINWDFSMTGRSGGAEYDIVQVSILVDIDPAFLNAFVSSLYKQNMGYVQTNLQIRTADPLDRASNGYLYGDSQVVEAEIQMEALFFRSWTAPIMPDTVRQQLGIKLAPPPAPGK